MWDANHNPADYDENLGRGNVEKQVPFFVINKDFTSSDRM